MKKTCCFLILAGFVFGTSHVAAEVRLDRFENPQLGIAGVAPNGWVEVCPGSFKRNRTAGDLTVLVQRSFPKIDTTQLMDITLLNRNTPLVRLPLPEGKTKGMNFDWILHQTDVIFRSKNMKLTVALAQTESHSHFVGLMAGADDFVSLREAVFLPALKSYKNMENAVPENHYKKNIHLFQYDKKKPLKITKLSAGNDLGYREIQLSYDSPKGGRVPATLFIPDGKGPFPGIVFMHGFPGSRQGMRSIALKYVRMGTVGISIDAPWTRPDRSDRGFPLTYSKIDREEQIQLMVDLSRAVDVLLARPDVDPTQLAYVGVSYGGAMGGLFSGIEKRLKAFILVIGDGGLMSHFFGIEDMFFGRIRWQDSLHQKKWFDLMWPVEPLHYVGHSAPAALLFQNGRTDTAVPAPDAIRYQLAGSEPKTVMWYDDGHNVSDERFRDQVKWLSKYLNFRR